MNVSVSPLGLCAGNGRVESVFLCVGSGCGWRVSKSRGLFFFFFLEISQEIIHHWREADRPGLCFILRSWGNYKSPGVRTSVSRPSCHLNTSCVFGDTRSSVFLRRTEVYSFELHGFLLLELMKAACCTLCRNVSSFHTGLLLLLLVLVLLCSYA